MGAWWFHDVSSTFCWVEFGPAQGVKKAIKLAQSLTAEVFHRESVLKNSWLELCIALSLLPSGKLT